MRNMEKYTYDNFDFIFIDGAHTWDADGFAFFLAEPMLREGGWILFDDLDWAPVACGDPKEADWVRSLPEEVRTTPAIRLVWGKLVLNHSSFGNYIEDGNWGWAQKVGASKSREFQYHVPVKSIVWRRLKDKVKKVGL